MRRAARVHHFRWLGACAGLALLLAAPVSAQGQAPEARPAVFIPEDGFRALAQLLPGRASSVRVNPEIAVSRMLSFDRNGDGRIETAELGERMHALVTRGDANGDGALDETEIRTLAGRPLAPSVRQIGGSNTYGFADDIGLSSRAHIEGAIDDLRLSRLRRDEVMQVVRPFMDARDRAAVAALMKELDGVVSAEQLAEVRAAAGKHQNIMIVARLVVGSGQATPTTRSLVIGAGVGGESKSLALQVGQPEAMQVAAAAVARYKARQRLSDVERAQLVDALKGVLSVTDRDDFRAAIERRPVVAARGLALASVTTDFVVR